MCGNADRANGSLENHQPQFPPRYAGSSRARCKWARGGSGPQPRCFAKWPATSRPCASFPAATPLAERTEGTMTIRTANCPLAEGTADHPEVGLMLETLCKKMVGKPAPPALPAQWGAEMCL